MMIAFRQDGVGRNIGRGDARRVARSDRNEDLHMKWETPEAIDFRFGMEITMYISNR